MSESKLRIAVIFGGESSEHEVSERSAASIIEHLSAEKYEVLRIGITKEGQWLLFSGPIEHIRNGSWVNDPKNMPAILSPDSVYHGLLILQEGSYHRIPLDVIFPVLHGKKGEDGTIQGIFEFSGIPYVGCDTLTSAICMDKAVTHTLLSGARDIEQTNYLWFFADRFDKAPDVIKDKIEARLIFPVFVKPANAGSSIGVSKVTKKEDLDAAILKAAKEDKKILVENGIVGQEVECAVMGIGDPIASGIGEIAVTAEFYDYDDKYVSGTSQCIIPAHISAETAQKVRRTAIRAFRHLGCTGLARVDFFVTEDQRVILNEINTLPGFTDISMFPKLWLAEGYSYGELLDQLISYALEKGSVL